MVLTKNINNMTVSGGYLRYQESDESTGFLAQVNFMDTIYHVSIGY